MTLQQLLKNSTENTPLQKPVICFTGNTYPLLFFSQFFHTLKETQAVIVPTMHDASALHAQLGTSFLGASSRYWLRSLDSCSKADQQSWIDYLQAYQGPHTIFFFSSAAPKKLPSSWQVITVPEHADSKLMQEMVQWHTKNNALQKSVVQKLKNRIGDGISLDNAALLVQYGLLLGSKPDQFFVEWFTKLFPSSHSLFTISQSLFAKQASQFFKQMKPVHEQYVPQFWVSFWSDQLWRACMYSKLMHAHRGADAKRIGFRLPFSFLNRDWRRYSQQELQQAHDYVYDIDYQLKHGGTPIALDLFYSKFLTGCFA